MFEIHYQHAVSCSFCKARLQFTCEQIVDSRSTLEKSLSREILTNSVLAKYFSVLSIRPSPTTRDFFEVIESSLAKTAGMASPTPAAQANSAAKKIQLEELFEANCKELREPIDFIHCALSGAMPILDYSSNRVSESKLIMCPERLTLVSR